MRKRQQKEESERRSSKRVEVGVIQGVADLEMIPETPNDAAVTNQRTFVSDSCKLLPGRAKSIIQIEATKHLRQEERRCFDKDANE